MSLRSIVTSKHHRCRSWRWTLSSSCPSGTQISLLKRSNRHVKEIIGTTMSDQSRQKATVYVGGLDNQVSSQTLHDAFIPFGDIVEVSLPKPEL